MLEKTAKDPLSKSEINKLEDLIRKGKDLDVIIANIKELINLKVKESSSKSEKKYKHLFNYSPLTIILFDSDGILIDINKAANSLMSMHTVDDLIGKHYREIWSFNKKNKQIIPLFDKYFEMLLEKGKPSEKEFPIYQSKGGIVWVHAYTSIFEINDNKFVQLLLEDITERKRSQQRLKESQEKFRTIAEQASIGIAIFQNKKVKYLNHAYADILGYPYDEVKRWSYEDIEKIIHSDDLAKVRNGLRKFQNEIENNDIVNYIARIKTKSNKMIWLETSLTSIQYQNKDAILVTGIDITEKKNAEKELKRLNRLKSELLRRTSHELKTPLVSIKGFSDLLTELYSQKLDKEMTAIVNEIKKGSDRLENLIKDILKASKLQSGKIKIHKTYGNLSAIIKKVLEELQGIIKSRKHSITLDIENRLYAKFEQKRIKEVIENLLVNAIKYTPPEGEIIITSERNSKFIKISIKDTGIGLTVKEQKTIFREFGKIEKYGKGWEIETEGTGLGLYICKKIIELHKGTIGVESQGKEKGSTFYFTLPMID